MRSRTIAAAVPPAPQDLTTVARKVDAEARAAVVPARPDTRAIEPREEPDARIASGNAPAAPTPAAPATTAPPATGSPG